MVLQEIAWKANFYLNIFSRKFQFAFLINEAMGIIRVLLLLWGCGNHWI